VFNANFISISGVIWVFVSNQENVLKNTMWIQEGF